MFQGKFSSTDPFSLRMTTRSVVVSLNGIVPTKVTVCLVKLGVECNEEVAVKYTRRNGSCYIKICDIDDAFSALTVGESERITRSNLNVFGDVLHPGREARSFDEVRFLNNNSIIDLFPAICYAHSLSGVKYKINIYDKEMDSWISTGLLRGSFSNSLLPRFN